MRALIPILFAFTAAANADELLVALDVNPLTGFPGDTLAFTGTLTNNTADTLFINADSFTFDIVGALDDPPFLNNAPISLDPGETSSDFEMFDVNIPVSQAPGAYYGVLTVLGGTDDTALNVLGSTDFEVDVTPEPASYLLVGGAIVLVLGRRGARSRLASLAPWRHPGESEWRRASHY
jgi:hypothetical protein